MRVRILLAVLFTFGISAVATSQTTRSYYNEEFKVGFKYPANWKVAKETKPIDDEPGFTSLAVVSPRSTGGQLRDASATLAIGTIDEAACKHFKVPTGGEETKAVRTKIGNLIFYKNSGEDGAAGSIGETDYYRTFRDGRCYEVSLMVFRRNTPKPDQNVRLAQRQLNTILYTVYFRN